MKIQTYKHTRDCVTDVRKHCFIKKTCAIIETNKEDSKDFATCDTYKCQYLKICR